MPRCENCGFILVLLKSRPRYKCAKCSRSYLQKYIEAKEFMESNIKQRLLDKLLDRRDRNKQWRLGHKEYYAGYYRGYYYENKEKCLERVHKYYQKHKEKYIARMHEYYQNHRESLKKNRREYYLRMKERIDKGILSYFTIYFRHFYNAMQKYHIWQLNSLILLLYGLFHLKEALTLIPL